MPRLHRAPLVPFLLLCACMADPLDAAREEQAIVGGAADPGDPEVALLYAGFGDGGYICSGTLISPRVILTAAHCLNFDAQPAEHYAYFGSDAIAETDPMYMARINVTRYEYDQAFDINNLYGGHDIGLVLLESAGPVAPKAYNRTAIDASVGNPVRLVGWGRTSGTGDDYGRKRQATSDLTDVTGELIEYGSAAINTCQGDSGGANFMTVGGVEVVAGITSFGDVGCDEFGAGTRVDRYASTFIDPFIEANDPPLCEMDARCAEGCAAPDPDCPCAADGFCDVVCEDLDSDPDCPDGCGADGQCVAAGCPMPDPDCDVGGDGDGSGGGGGDGTGGGDGSGGGAGGDGADPTGQTSSTIVGGCSAGARGRPPFSLLVVIGLALALRARRR